MSIKTKLKINLNLFIIMSSYMALEWYENDIRQFIDSFIPVITVP